MKIQRIIRKRRGVSPILAVILLVGLAVAAGAALFVVVLPMISDPGGEFSIDDTTTFSNSSLHLVLKNEGTGTPTVTNVTVIHSGGDNANFTFTKFSVSKGAAKIKDYTFDEILTIGTWTVTVTFEVGDDPADTLKREYELK